MKKYYAAMLLLIFSQPIFACNIPTDPINIGEILSALKCLDQKIDSRLPESSSAPTNLEVLKKKFEFSTKYTIYEHGIKFSVSECRRSSQVVCNLRFISVDKDVEITLFRSTRIVDENGYESNVEFASIGGIDKDLVTSNSLRKRLIANIPTVSKIRFPLPEKGTIALSALIFEIKVSGKDRTVMLRNLLLRDDS